jgi:hypothetical protein
VSTETAFSAIASTRAREAGCAKNVMKPMRPKLARNSMYVMNARQAILARWEDDMSTFFFFAFSSAFLIGMVAGAH